MKSTKLFLLTGLFLSVSFIIRAQEQFSGWAASFNTIKLNDKLSIHFDGQFRSSAQVKHLQTILLRPGLNFRLKKNITLSGGYGFISNRRTSGAETDRATEHRFWELVIVSHKIADISTSHRFRFEQRLLPTPGAKRVYANRFRYFIRNVLPLRKEPAFSSGIFLALQNEVLLNFGNKSVVNGKTFDQNRLYLATGYRLTSKVDLEMGYMNQYVSRAANRFTNNHILQLASYVRL